MQRALENGHSLRYYMILKYIYWCPGFVFSWGKLESVHYQLIFIYQFYIFATNVSLSSSWHLPGTTPAFEITALHTAKCGWKKPTGILIGLTLNSWSLARAGFVICRSSGRRNCGAPCSKGREEVIKCTKINIKLFHFKNILWLITHTKG